MLKTPNIIETPWGHEEIWANAPSYTGKILVIKPNQRLSRKYHKMRGHTIRVIEGDLIIEVGPSETQPEVTEVKLTAANGLSYHIPAMVIHRICAGAQGAKLVEVSNAFADDFVRLEDDYRRVTDIPKGIRTSGK